MLIDKTTLPYEVAGDQRVASYEERHRPSMSRTIKKASVSQCPKASHPLDTLTGRLFTDILNILSF